MTSVPVINESDPLSIFEAGQYYYEYEDYTQAKQLWEKVITNYPESEYAVKALVQLFHLSKVSKLGDFDVYIANIRNGKKVPAALYRKAMILETYRNLRESKKEAALLLAKEMTDEKHKGTQAELYGLYTIAMSSDKGTQEALNSLKERYPNNPLTYIACEEHNEQVDWGKSDLSKSLVDGKGEYFTNENDIPKKFALHENYPNPFNPTTHIQFDLPEDSEVKLVVYNIEGKEVKELVNGFKTAGSYNVDFDGFGLASGIYFYRIDAHTMGNVRNYSQVKRMLLIK